MKLQLVYIGYALIVSDINNAWNSAWKHVLPKMILMLPASLQLLENTVILSHCFLWLSSTFQSGWAPVSTVGYARRISVASTHQEGFWRIASCGTLRCRGWEHTSFYRRDARRASVENAWRWGCFESRRNHNKIDGRLLARQTWWAFLNSRKTRRVGFPRRETRFSYRLLWDENSPRLSL